MSRRNMNDAGKPCSSRSARLVRVPRLPVEDLRDAFNGVRRYSQFQRSLGIAKDILISRLRDLVAAGVLSVVPASDGTSYQEYVLTSKGQDLFDLMISLRQWGQDHAFAPGEEHSLLVDEATGQPVPRLSYTTPEGRPVQARQTRVRKPQETAQAG